jgi:response regulator RpfG family c-di-GMP phosphodiesterase
MKTNLVLLVDDEPNVRNSLSRELLEMDVCEVLTAQNGEEGLKVLRKNPKIAVIVSDYRMPGMDGIKFLTEAQRIVPDTTRIMLTGAADLEMAIEAVNSGRIFRFLLKPCPTEVFLNAIKASIRQNQLILGEREFLTKTLNGSIQILIDVLAAIDPESFAHAHRLRQLAHHLAVRLKLEQLWEVDLAALLSQIGSVTIPY